MNVLIFWINALSFGCGISVTKFGDGWPGMFLSLACFAGVCKMTFRIHEACPEKASNETVGDSFRTPFLPFLPCAAIFVNWYLVAQLEAGGEAHTSCGERAPYI